MGLQHAVLVQVPSDQNIPFNEKPEMKSKEITKLGVEALKSGKYDQVGSPTASVKYLLHLRSM